MRLLVLGGTHHVGRAVVETALDRGDEVTTVTRGASGDPDARAEARYADRTDAAALAATLGDDTWDAVVDTWSFAPLVVSTAARLMSGRARHYTYVSSRSVYRWPIERGVDESAPVVAGHPTSQEADDYAASKRGGELAAVEGFDGAVLLARPGLILGPYEQIGRLPFWLGRIAAGGRVPAPGPPDRPLQLIDARDLAAFVLSAADRGVSGALNTVSVPGHATMRSILDACVDATGAEAELVWIDPATIEAADVAPWTELPIWLPPTGELAALHDGDVSAALGLGLVCRPIEETVADTWAWLQAEGVPEQTRGRPATGLGAEAEARLWAARDAAAVG